MKELNYKEAREFILQRPGSKGIHTLKKIKLLLEKFDNPQDKINVIHIAGTNGKGSTTKFLSQVFSKDYKTGSFTSPYIRKINEALAINGDAISDEDFASLISRVHDYVLELEKEGYYLSYFEVLTGIMYIYFYEKKVDIAIVETGLGGLLDSTNIIKNPLASVITTISKDHMDILGNSLEEIAYQKAGIIKEGSPVFLYPQEDEVYEVIKERADYYHSKLYTFRTDELNIRENSQRRNIFDFRDHKNVEISLLGLHQIYNAALSLMVLDYFKDSYKLDEDSIKMGLLKADNPGRLTKVSDNPRVIVDGSHNRQAIDCLIESIRKFSYNRLIIGFSVLRDKEYDYIIEKLSKVANEMLVTSIDNPRAFEIDELEQIVKGKFPKAIAIEDSIKAYQYSKKIAGPDDLVIWCGSLYLISEIINYEERRNGSLF